MSEEEQQERAPSGDALRRAVRAAIAAPSVHNTQPWRYRIRGHVLDVFADRSRQLTSLDPTGRLLFVSCGCAVAMATARLRADGWEPEVELVPDPREPDRVAEIRVTGRPTATPEEHLGSLADAVERRHSQRAPFLAAPVPPHVMDRLRDVARTEGAWFRPLRSDTERLLFTSLLDNADWQQSSDPGYRRELRAWLRTAPAPDGVPRAALPDADPAHGDLLLRDFDPEGPAAARRAVGRQRSGDPVGGTSGTSRSGSGAAEAVALIGTDRDRPVDWLAAGRALGAVLLELTVAGWQASVLGQVVDLPDSRRRLRHGLGLRGPVQIALRIGRGPVTVPTPRRPMADVLTVVRRDERP